MKSEFISTRGMGSHFLPILFFFIFIFIILLSPCLGFGSRVNKVQEGMGIPNTSPLYLDISGNQFHGPLPSLPPNTVYFSASNNMFSGEIPSSFCSATGLAILDLSNNTLTGTLPPCFLKLSTNLSVLKLGMNKIGGVIPDIFRGGSHLRTLDLSQNRFHGSFPRSLQSCQKLQVLDLSNNLIEDTFPSWLAMLPELRVLVLRSNRFHGDVNTSDGLHPFSQLQILDLSENDFSGLLPGHYFRNLVAMISSDRAMSYLHHSGRGLMAYQDSVTVRMKGVEIKLVRIFSIFMSIDLSSNNFRGPVPTEISNLKSLKGLNLSHNSLTGGIPSSLRNLTALEWLDLSANMLEGGIPQQMADLDWLAVLNLSENRLVGPIPSGKQFNTFTSSSFEGNPGLCGFPLPIPCKEQRVPSPELENHEDQGDWMSWRRAALIGYGPGLVLGISLGYIFLETSKPTWLARFVSRLEPNLMQASTRKATYSH